MPRIDRVADFTIPTRGSVTDSDAFSVDGIFRSNLGVTENASLRVTGVRGKGGTCPMTMTIRKPVGTQSR